MQYITSLIYFSILIMMVLLPLIMPLLLKRKGIMSNLFLGSFLSFMICVLLVFVFAYLSDLETNLRLGYLGFNFDGFTDEERLRNIAPELRDEAVKLYHSHMGIGWPFKAMMGAVFLIPYHIVGSGFGYIVSKRRYVRIR
jgi:hypothetical protein